MKKWDLLWYEEILNDLQESRPEIIWDVMVITDAYLDYSNEAIVMISAKLNSLTDNEDDYLYKQGVENMKEILDPLETKWGMGDHAVTIEKIFYTNTTIHAVLSYCS